MFLSMLPTTSSATWKRRQSDISSGDSKTDMTVSWQGRSDESQPLTYVLFSVGEVLEKVTRVLTPEEQALLDQDWVGKNGTKRKMEVS
jgi:hypothetical protein